MPFLFDSTSSMYGLVSASILDCSFSADISYASADATARPAIADSDVIFFIRLSISDILSSILIRLSVSS